VGGFIDADNGMIRMAPGQGNTAAAGTTTGVEDQGLLPLPEPVIELFDGLLAAWMDRAHESPAPAAFEQMPQ